MTTIYDLKDINVPIELDCVVEHGYSSTLMAICSKGNITQIKVNFDFKDDDTVFGYVYRGQLQVIYQNGLSRIIYQNDCFSLVGVKEIKVFEGTEAYATVRHKWIGQDHVGQVEENGRLKYIDGCFDSLLVAPPKFGDACLNYLQFPAGINQTAHTHPSVRMGMVYEGAGHCVVPGNEIDLKPGIVFCIHPDGEHKFRTDKTDIQMKVIAYHPDSDFGPKDEFHPMINRTMVEGKSANSIDDIRTK